MTFKDEKVQAEWEAMRQRIIDEDGIDPERAGEMATINLGLSMGDTVDESTDEGKAVVERMEGR